MAESSRRLSPYNYANNNPLRFIDPDGRRAASVENFESNVPVGSLWGYCIGGGRSAYNSVEEYLGSENPFMSLMMGAGTKSGGGGDGSGNSVGISVTGNMGIAAIQSFLANGGSINMLFEELNHEMNLVINAINLNEKARVYILNKKASAIGFGHLAVMGGNEAHGYRYVSIQGDDTVADLDLKTDGHQPYDNFSKYENNDRTEGDDITFKTESTAIKWLESQGYTRMFSIEVSYKAVGIVLNEVVRYGTSQPYDTLTRNCADGVISGLNKAGLPSFSGLIINTPNSVYNGLKDMYNLFFNKQYNPINY